MRTAFNNGKTAFNNACGTAFNNACVLKIPFPEVIGVPKTDRGYRNHLEDFLSNKMDRAIHGREKWHQRYTAPERAHQHHLTPLHIMPSNHRKLTPVLGYTSPEPREIGHTSQYSFV